MKRYLVGGAVRDMLLGQPCHDLDYVVTEVGAEQLRSAGFLPVGQSFGIFLHPDSGDEYVLTDNLLDDLARRDLTINAMARADSGEIIDPFAGQCDLQARLLRHVSDQSFREDPIRILRTARFAARYQGLGFRIAPETWILMQVMVEEHLLDHWVAERVWAEIEKALAGVNCARFFEILQQCGALQKILPAVAGLFGVPQAIEHHPEIDAGLHSLMVLAQAEQMSGDIATRFAALLHDVGKGSTDSVLWPKHPWHGERGVALLEQMHQQLRPPRQCYELAVLASLWHTAVHRWLVLSAEEMLMVYESTDAFRRPDRFARLLDTCVADCRGRLGYEQAQYPQADWAGRWLHVLRELPMQDIYQQYQGVAIKQQVRARRLEVLQACRAACPEQ